MAIHGLLTDIHGNLEALQAALEVVEERGIRSILCMGDLVGYNADSDEVVRILEERRAVCIAGNHDLIALGELGTDRCWYQAAHALSRTRQTLRPSTRAFLRAMPMSAMVEGHVLLVHGDLDDAQHYMRTAKDVAASAARVRTRHREARVVLYGHTHDPRCWRVRAGVERLEASDFRLQASDFRLQESEEDEIVYINPGSIDGQRKPPGERTAEFAILDTDENRLELLSIRYDDATTEKKAARQGYRVSAADKLAHESKRFIGRVRRALSPT